MRVQKQVNRVVDDKEYAKYVVIIPPEDIQKLEWKDGQELDHEVKDQRLILSKAEPVSEEEVLKIARKYEVKKAMIER